MFVSFLHNPIYAAKDYMDDKAVVFLLDASGSMNTNDPTKLALDSVMQVIYSLPSNYKVAVVAYSDDVILKTELVDSEKRRLLAKEVNNIHYNGYTNAAAGIKSAVEILSETNKGHIIMLSDGEILLKNSEATKKAEKLFKKQIKRAKNNNITVDFIGFVDESLIGSAIGSISKKTAGKAYYASKAIDIQNIIDEILIHNLNVKKTTLGLIESDGTTQNIKVDFPLKNMSKARILLTSNKPITNLVADVGADKSLQDSGKRYSLIELDNPRTESINIFLDSKKKSKIKLELIPECLVDIEHATKYKDTLSTDRKKGFYNRTADITFEFSAKTNKNKKIFDEEQLNDEIIYANINGKVTELKLLNGQVRSVMDVLETQDITVLLDFKDLPVNVLGNKEITIHLEKPSLFERIDIISYLIIILMLIILVMMILVLRKKKMKKAQSIHIERINEFTNMEKTESNKYYYKGKFNIYITKNKTGIDILPLTFNLFRLSNGRKITLFEILKELKIEEIFEGSEKIIFQPGENKKLIMRNNSDSTIIKNREIILKNTVVEIYIDSKIDIIFEDEKSEMMLQYKDI